MNLLTELKRRNVVRVGVAYMVASWLVLQILDVVGPIVKIPDWVSQALLLLLVIGFVAAVIIAWAYELTPEGVKRADAVDPNASITAQTGRKLNLITIGLLVAVAVLVLADRFMLAPESTVQQAPAVAGSEQARPAIAQPAVLEPEPANDIAPATPSVAVLPFVNMSADPDNEYFSDGISEELLNLLVRVEGLRVPSRTSSFAFKGLNTDIRDIARQLDVGHILEGSVRKAGNRVRITAQLIEVGTDTHLWSETYDRELEDIFAIQDEISSHIVEALQLVLGQEQVAGRGDERPTDDLEAYEEYLRGRYLFMQRGISQLNASMKSLLSAVARDPQFAEAWAALSQTATTLSGWDPKNAAKTNLIAIDAAQKALALQPDSAAAMAGLGLTYFQLGRWAESLEMLETAEPLARESTPVYWHGLVLQAAGYIREAETKLKHAVRMDPVYPQLQYWMGLNSLIQNRDEDARERFQLTANAHNPNGNYGLNAYFLRKGEFDTAAEHLIRNVTLAQAVATRELMTEERILTIRDGLKDPSQHEAAARAAVEQLDFFALAALGEESRIIEVLKTLLSEGQITDVVIAFGDAFWNGEFRALRQLDGFKALQRETGLVDLWKSRGWPDLCRPVGEGDFACD